MKQAGKIFLCYFPILLVAGQVAIDVLSLVSPSTYTKAAFYLGAVFGTNVFVALFMLVFAFHFKFCLISRAAAIAEILFAVNFLVIQEDNLYNIMFQIIVGTLALLVTLRCYVKKFPLCRISLLYTFMACLIKSGSCTHAMDEWHKEVIQRVKSTL